MTSGKTCLVTGVAGFIGFHVAKKLMYNGFRVIGVDALTDYYDVKLKLARLNILKQNENFEFEEMKIQSDDFLHIKGQIDLIIHLAAQAGVRYSITNPKDYVDTNLVGTFHVLELAKLKNVSHLMLASTSSVYGANTVMPFQETDQSDHQLSFYAATKKSNECMAHSYSHIFSIPITAFRFFTVYGPWGRPDMALYKFADLMFKQKPIDIYNFGQMKRDFTYIDDLVESIHKLTGCIPVKDAVEKSNIVGDSLSPVAPYRVVNIGNARPVLLNEYIAELEASLGIEAKKNYLPMQPGDVEATYANTSLLTQLTNYQCQTTIKEGVRKFSEWYLEYKKTCMNAER